MIEFLTEEQVRQWKQENPDAITIKLPSGTGKKQRISDMVMKWSLDEMKRLIEEVENESHSRNDYARSICNEALTRKGLSPCF